MAPFDDREVTENQTLRYITQWTGWQRAHFETTPFDAPAFLRAWLERARNGPMAPRAATPKEGDRDKHRDQKSQQKRRSPTPLLAPFPGLNFIVEHVGLPRLDDFCWIATQESNVYAGLSVAMAFVHLRPRYFGEIMANLLFWLGPDKLCFGSDYAIWSPKWLIEKFISYGLPEDLKQEYHVDLTLEIKQKILGENIARLYGIDIPAQTAKVSRDGIAARQ